MKFAIVAALASAALGSVFVLPAAASSDAPVIALTNAYYGNTWRHQMVEAFDRRAVQSPTLIVASYLVLDRLVAKEAADESPFGLPARVDLHLVGDRRRSAIVIEYGRAPKQPASAARLEQRSVAPWPVEPHPCGEFTQPGAPVTG